MKNILTALLVGITLQTANAQKPQKVQPYSREQNPITWYKEQAEAWKKVLDKNPKDAAAWYNYYYATRLLLRMNPEEKRTEEQKNEVFNKIAADMEKQLPHSYEYNMIKWLIGGSDMKYVPYLKKAEEIASNRIEHLDGMINLAEIERDVAARDRYSKKKYEAGDLSAGMLSYNYNTLIGLEPNAILITSGDNDTYPAYALQALGIRKDVHVVNVSLMQIDEYRDRVFKEIGLEPWEKLWGNTHSANEAALQRFHKGIIRYMANNSKKYPLYLALTASYLTDKTDPPVESELYVTGLSMRYSKVPVDNIAFMKKNIEQLYALDYLDKHFSPDISADLVKQINMNYIIPMLKLYEHYKLSGDSQRRAWIEEKIHIISDGTEIEEKVKTYLAEG
ncbi:MAG: hypothetical protein EOP56_15575 [Sphingobacteriales bacterium]|nr:MAG: hypothetical protein EOP56_15575 [Sphingobacteriales bacterium]